MLRKSVLKKSISLVEILTYAVFAVLSLIISRSVMTAENCSNGSNFYSERLFLQSIYHDDADWFCFLCRKRYAANCFDHRCADVKFPTDGRNAEPRWLKLYAYRFPQSLFRGWINCMSWDLEHCDISTQPAGRLRYDCCDISARNLSWRKPNIYIICNAAYVLYLNDFCKFRWQLLC